MCKLYFVSESEANCKRHVHMHLYEKMHAAAAAVSVELIDLSSQKMSQF